GCGHTAAQRGGMGRVLAAQFRQESARLSPTGREKLSRFRRRSCQLRRWVGRSGQLRLRAPTPPKPDLRRTLLYPKAFGLLVGGDALGGVAERPIALVLKTSMA